MYVPFTNLLPALDPAEVNRVRSSRPATRAEILERHLRLERTNRVFSAPEETPRLARITHEPSASVRPARPALRTPATKVRRSIGRALIAAGQRLDREAA